MRTILNAAIAASALIASAALTGTTAQARTDFSISIGVPNAVTFDYDSGGYCDSYGCPEDYWDYPVWYGPVYYHRAWYRGPLYYRDDLSDTRVYWIAGGWHHDQWRGARPGWWNRDRYYAGPALGYEYYAGHGFRHHRDRYWRGNDWTGWQNRDWQREGHGNDWNNGGDRRGRHDSDWRNNGGNWNNGNGNDNRDWRNNGGNWNSGNGNDNRDRHNGSDNRGNWRNANGQNNPAGNGQYNSSGQDNHGNGQAGGKSGWYPEQGKGVVTTTASPAAVYNAKTGQPANATVSGKGGNNSNGDRDGRRHRDRNNPNGPQPQY